jgi:FkbM family methyltransferase
MGFSGAKVISLTPEGNTILQLNASTALGKKGDLIALPRDRTIFESVKNSGTWEIEESKFLAKGLLSLNKLSGTNIALLDIGANTGLVSLQAMNIARTDIDVHLFEPIPRHVAAIKYNLRSVQNSHIFQFALSDSYGEAEIFTETHNHGNTSLLRDVVPLDHQFSTTIKLVDTTNFCENNLLGYDAYVIKCDTQGMDALILSRLPKSIWQKCTTALIEVWALPQVNEAHVEELLSRCQEFEYVNWVSDSPKSVTLEEVRDFWLGKSGSPRNLFLSK